jgi:hypothetical protein
MRLLALACIACATPAPIEPWAECPSAAAYEGPSSAPVVLDVPEGTMLCAVPGGNGSPSETFAALMQTMVIAGEYPLAIENTTPYTLPLCMRGQDGPLPTPPSGTLRYMMFTIGDTTYRQWWADRSLPDGTLSFRIAGASTDDRIAIEPERSPLSSTSVDIAINGTVPAQLFECGGPVTEVFQVTHARGSVTMSVRVVGMGIAGGAPYGLLRSASGSLDGQSFVQSDYFDLVYIGGHHGWTHRFLVRLEEPIGATCGFSIEVDTYPDPGGTLTLLDCTLAPAGDLSLSSVAN